MRSRAGPTETDASADALVRAVPVAAVLAARGEDDAAVLEHVDAVVALTQRDASARAHAAAVATAVANLVRGRASTPLGAVFSARATEGAADTVMSVVTAATRPALADAVGDVAASLGFAERPTKLIA